MVAHAVAVAEPGDRRAVVVPLGRPAAVPAACQVDHLALAVGLHDAHLVGPLAGVQELHHEPLAVRAPLVPLVAIGVAVVAVGGQHGARLLAGHVQHPQFGALLQVGHFLAVRTVGGLELLGGGGQQRLLLQQGGLEEVLLFLAHDAGGVQVPAAIALAGVEQLAALGVPAHAALLLGRVGDAARGALQAGHEHLPAVDEGHLLAAGRRHHFVHVTVHLHGAGGVVAPVGHHPDGHPAGLSTICHRVDAAAVGEAEHPAVADAEPPHRVVRQEAHLRAGAARGGHLVHVEAAVLLAQVVDAAPVRAPDRVAVLPGEGGQLPVLPGGGVVGPHIARHAAGVVLAVAVLVALAVVVHDQAAVRRVACQLHGDGAHLLRPSAGHRHGVQFAQPAHGEVLVPRIVLPVGVEEHLGVVRTEARGVLAVAVVGQPCGHSAIGAHHEHIAVAMAGAGEGDQLAVVAPHGRLVVGLVGGKGHGIAAAGRHTPDVSLETEQDGLAVRRNGGFAQPEGLLRTTGKGGEQRRERKGTVHAAKAIRRGDRSVPGWMVGGGARDLRSLDGA